MQRLRDQIVLALLVVTAVFFAASYYEIFFKSELITHDAIIWYGSFHYYLACLAGGHFPYWDPYMLSGTLFYPNVSILGLLDPSLLLCLIAVKMTPISPLTVYVAFRMIRFAIFLGGAYLLIAKVTRSRYGSLIATVVLLFAMAPSYFRQAGTIDLIIYTPLILFSVIRFVTAESSADRYLSLFAVALMTGITMNIFIPAYALFNLATFIVMLLVFRVVPVSAVAAVVRDRRMQLAVGAAILIVAMMAAPPLTVLFRDASADGELFPMLRIVQKNDGHFKRIMATDIGNDVLSDRFTGQKGVFASYGNIVNMVYPDIFESVPFFADDLLAEIAQYIGIIPLLLALIGAMYHASRYRAVALVMLLIITVNMFSFAGMSGKPFNIVQQFFNILFPPLKMIEVREAFGSFFLLYAALLVGMGMSLFLNQEKREWLLREKRVPIALIGAGIVVFKIIVTYVYGGKIVVASRYDLYIFVQIGLFVAGLFLMHRKQISFLMFTLGLLGLLCIDFTWYSRYSAKYVLADNPELQAMVRIGKIGAERKDFEYFRLPIVSPPGIAFGESIVGMKGALTYGNNHSIFTTKRYYDLLTNVPIETQLLLSNVISPLVGFYAPDRVRFARDRQEAFAWVRDHSGTPFVRDLVLERPDDFLSVRRREIGSMQEYEDVPELNVMSLYSAQQSFMARYGGLMQLIREGQWQMLNMPSYSLEVRSHAPNEVIMAVRNHSDGYLYYGDGWSQHWRAYDNGKEIPVLIANYNSKAVFLPPGDHEVRFVFDPMHYKVGLVLYYAGLALAVLLVVILWLRSRRENRPVIPHASVSSD